MGKWSGLCLSLIFLGLCLHPAIAGSSQSVSSELKLSGWLEEYEDFDLVVLQGSFYEMGWQQGVLLSEKIHQNLRAFNESMQTFGISYTSFVEMWEVQKEYISEEANDFIQGTADALGVDQHIIGVLWVWEGVLYCMRCSSFACWGNQTVDGGLVHVRSLDSLGLLEDPVSGRTVTENAVVIVCHPDEGNAFLYPTIAGYGVEDGFNEKGISVCNLWSVNSDGSRFGSPMGVRLFDALWMANSSEEAIDIITEQKTFGYNFVVCDGEKPSGYAVETTKNLTYVGSWDDPVEDTWPFYQMEETIRRSNCFVSSELAETQRDVYNPKDWRYLLGLREGYGWYNCWMRYQAMSRGIEKASGSLDVESALEVMRDVYKGRYHVVWWLTRMSSPDICAWWQWSCCPSSGDIVLSFADDTIIAYRNEVHVLNLFEILED